MNWDDRLGHAKQVESGGELYLAPPSEGPGAVVLLLKADIRYPQVTATNEGEKRRELVSLLVFHTNRRKENCPRGLEHLSRMLQPANEPSDVEKVVTQERRSKVGGAKCLVVVLLLVEVSPHFEEIAFMSLTGRNISQELPGFGKRLDVGCLKPGLEFHFPVSLGLLVRPTALIIQQGAFFPIF